ncbi:hypothetical protein AMATHDRAFT_45352 [Amanita thiersii Skay4041]|uniref:CRIB domain-containing protein n=1 Tax=Amanita thiersii Skay4041 TaxID=703135 RepID=A0A2A9NTP5_9AGAR|nr:hypothetical protein AMATHDRAFT_45352 [Amanita thiersii Skay4041]
MTPSSIMLHEPLALTPNHTRCTSPLGEIVISDLPQSSHIIAMASTRYYHAQLGPKSPQWAYSRYRGLLVFGKNVRDDSETTLVCRNQQNSMHDANSEEIYWFRLMVPKTDELKTVWLFKFANDLNYQVERPFFHIIQGLVCTIHHLEYLVFTAVTQTRRYGFLFDDDDEALTFADKVIAQCSSLRSISPRTRRGKPKSRTTSPTSSASISLPLVDTFRHLAHVGLGDYGMHEGNIAELGLEDLINNRHIQGRRTIRKGIKDIDAWHASGVTGSAGIETH